MIASFLFVAVLAIFASGPWWWPLALAL